jgi:hypothetical protein
MDKEDEMTFRFRKIGPLGTACCLALACDMMSLSGGAVCGQSKSKWPLPDQGWHDEMNDLSAWKPLEGINEPDVFAARSGAMTLRMPHVPAGFPYSYQWGGVTRRASVDLGAYPVLVAYVSRLQQGSYAHLDLEERDYAGKPVRTLRTPMLQGKQDKGLIILDVGKEWGKETRRVHLRLIVGGPLSGAACEYAWVRFVRREDVPKLQARLR